MSTARDTQGQAQAASDSRSGVSPLGTPFRVELGDCMKLLKAQGNRSVRAVVTDPPYMIGAISAGNAKSKAGSWEDLMNASFWYRAWMAEAWRVLEVGGYLVVFLNWRTLPMLMKACADSNIPTTSLAVWDKAWIGPAGPSQLRPTYEMILFCGKGPAQIVNRSQADMFRHKWMARLGPGGHPAEKPVPLLRQIVELVAKPGDRVLDCFMGSGSTGVAALLAGCAFVGYEANPRHFEIAADRLSRADDQVKALPA